MSKHAGPIRVWLCRWRLGTVGRPVGSSHLDGHSNTLRHLWSTPCRPPSVCLHCADNPPRGCYTACCISAGACLQFEVACLPGSWHLIACQAEEAGRLAELTSWQIAKSCLTHAMVQVMNNRAGFAFQQFVDLPYTWAYNGSSLVNTVLRTTDNNTNPVSRLVFVLADSELLCTSTIQRQSL